MLRVWGLTFRHSCKLPTVLLGIVLAVPAQAADWPLFQGNPTRNAIAANPLPPPLEVVLPRGPVVRIAPGFDPATLRQLLAVLDAEAAC